MSDLFDAPLPDPRPKPKVGRAHSETSQEAAAKIEPALPNIRARLLDKLLGAREAGLTDDELALELPDIITNSLRAARVGLTDELWVLDSGQRRENARGNECIAWVHRDYHPSAPELGQSKSQAKAGLRAMREEAAEIAAKLPPEIAYLKGEGRIIIARYLERAVEVLTALSQARD